MHKVSESYIEALSEKVYDDRISGKIVLKSGDTITVSDSNLVKNSLKITKELCGKEYKIGSFNLACLKMAVFDKGALGRDYSNAVITLSYHLKLKNGGEEAVPLGIFIADGGEISRKKDKVYITAYDGGIYFDREPSENIRNMTATPIELITAICEECGAELGNIDENLPNREVSVNISDKQIQTCRDAVMWCSALMCGYAVIDREGKLNIISARYSVDESGTTITKNRSIGVKERNSISSTDTRAYLRYLTAYCGDEVRQYDSGYEATDKQAAPASYAMARNPLLSGKSEEEWDKINRAWHKYIERFMQRGVTARIFGDPAIDVGDTISFYGGDIDQRGNVIGIVTSYEWKYRNYHDIVCSAAECGEKGATECVTPSTKVRNQTEKRIDALSANMGGLSTVLSAVSFDKNRLYYNGETYHLQFGWNKRIMCVTKGDKHAIINSPDYTGSRIEAATAVMKGLTEDWDIVFDNYCCENAEGYTLNISSILKNYSGAVKCDWGDGTSDNETSHTYYNTACVVVKVKLLGDIPSEMQINSMDIMWSVTTNERFWVHNIGARLYIGGLIKGAYITSHGNSVTHICYGENIKSVKGSLSYPQVAERQFEVGIPPFVESISGSPYMYNGASYIYIPESCVSISNMAFAYNGASEIEIEEKGEALTIGANAFGYTASKENYNRLDVLRLPARVVQESGSSILEDCYVRAVIYGRGRTEIPSQLCYRAENGDYLSEIEDKPYFIFIPRTVTSIGDFLLYPYSNPKRQVYIICEGSWSSITKSSNWDGASGGRGNIEIYSESCLYNSAENIIDTFIRKR